MIERLFERITSVIELGLALVLIAAVCLNFANVLDRYVLGASILGADELQVFIMVWMTFLAAAVVAWRGKHLRMDALTPYVPERFRAALRISESALLLVLAGLAFVLSWRYTWDMFVLQQKSNTAGIPMWIPHGAVPLGFGLIALIAGWQALRSIRSGASARTAAGKDAHEGTGR